jgi:hypothetical protein
VTTLEEAHEAGSETDRGCLDVCFRGLVRVLMVNKNIWISKTGNIRRDSSYSEESFKLPFACFAQLEVAITVGADGDEWFEVRSEHWLLRRRSDSRLQADPESISKKGMTSSRCGVGPRLTLGCV